MRHRVKGKKFGRIAGRRKSFLRNLVNDLIRSEKIRTTEARAKALRPLAERMVTIAKRGDLSARRLLLARLGNKRNVERLLLEIAPRYRERKGGYLRIIKSGKRRKRDGAPLATLEFV
jgi:large subunit ribosomal protein L17